MKHKSHQIMKRKALHHEEIPNVMEIEANDENQPPLKKQKQSIQSNKHNDSFQFTNDNIFDGLL